MSFFEWLGRVIMLVLAGMITLSIIGAIAAIPSGIVQDGIRMTEREPLPAPPEQARPTPLEPGPSPEAQAPDAAGQVVNHRSVAPAQPEPIDPAEWLESITYALLALVGIAAPATVILWRMLRERRRMADALEALSRAGLPASSSRPS
jgi:hypothetical protein